MTLPDAWFAVKTGLGPTYCVDAENRTALERDLDAAIVEWVTFTDLSGGRIKWRRDDILGLVESTPAIRQRDRELMAAQKAEEGYAE